MKSHINPPTLNNLLERLRSSLPKLKKQYGIVQLGVFGSYVRGEQTPNSDLDLLVEFDSNHRFGLLTFCELENQLSDQLGVKVDLVIKTGLKPRIGERILTEVQYL